MNELIKPQWWLGLINWLLIAHLILALVTIIKTNKVDERPIDKLARILIIVFLPIIGPMLFLYKGWKPNSLGSILLLCSLSFYLIGCDSRSSLKDELRKSNPSLSHLDNQYKYIDKEGEITISKDDFQELLKSDGRPVESINSYYDSLSVIITKDLGNKEEANEALFALSYSWKRLAYYLWSNEAEAKDLAKRYNLRFPIEMKVYLEKEELHDDYLKEYLKGLKQKVYDEKKDEAILSLNNQDFLKYTLVNNPNREKDFSNASLTANVSSIPGNGELTTKTEAEATSTTSKGAGCGRKDCCMLKKKK
jgi:hypothetical protein